MDQARLARRGTALSLCAFASAPWLVDTAHAAGSNATGTHVALATARASPEKSEPILVAFSDCDSEPLGKQAFLKVLALELGRGPVRESSGEAASISVSYRCDGVARVHISMTPDVERELRVDDVGSRERARALALAIAELARGGEPAASQATSAAPNNESANESTRATEKPSAASDAGGTNKAPTKPDKASSDSAAKASRESHSAKSQPADAETTNLESAAGPVSTPSRASDSVAALVAGALRVNLQIPAVYYGAALALDYQRFRLQLEGLAGYASVPRGSITSGLASLRLAYGIPLIGLGGVQTGVAPSVAAGVNWALGSSDVPNTLVRRVVQPYADARLALWATSKNRSRFTPLLELYAGRAAGIVANAEGIDTLATGGWFSGVELGLWL
ncbi:MAG: hypothetical protein ACOY0T_08425 [Myxococcota bacterium]